MGIFEGLRHNVMNCIQEVLQVENVYAKNLMAAYKFAKRNNINEYKIAICSDKKPAGEHVRRYNAPETNEIAILMPNDPEGERDIIIRNNDGSLKKISEFHPAYDALQYPLLFPKGTNGWSIQLKLSKNKLTLMNYYAMRIMTCPGNYILYARRLFQQFVVDAYAIIESERLFWMRREQSTLRADSYQELTDALNAADGDPTNVGQRVILPSSYIGGPRYMLERQQDAMTYVRQYGKADLFITMTTNPRWIDITVNLFEGQNASDRPDLCARIFKLKLRKMMDLIKDGAFGKVRAWLYSIEFQKRGLPHAHILIWLMPEDKLTPDKFDRTVSAEIPDINTDPDLFNIVTKNMIHGPCGNLNPGALCMKNGKCTKGFPKNFVISTEIGDDCYPKYRRRHPSDGGKTAAIHTSNEDKIVDNSWVVPYNSWLLRQMNCHINVEICSSVKSIKYVLKYIGSTEAAWRILPIHERFPPVISLAVHLENGQHVYFTAQNARERVANDPPATTLTAFFSLCQTDDCAATLLYTQVPPFYTWNNTAKKWRRRVRGNELNGHVTAPAVGRIYTVSPRQGECFYLRLLLHHVRGPKSFEDLKTVDGNVCQTFRDACLLRGLLQDDNAHHMALEEASTFIFPYQMRNLFATIVVHCDLSNPNQLWQRHKDSMSEDFIHALDITQEEAMEHALLDIEENVMRLGGKSLENYALPRTNRTVLERIGVYYRREIQYNINEQRQISERNSIKLNVEQRAVHDEFVEAALNGQAGIFFLDAPGGCGKTFFLQTILASIRAEQKIVLATASCGLAATLLSGGRTIHSTFKVPLNLNQNENPMCAIKKGTSLARLIKDCRAMIVDEAPMTNKLVFEALNRSLQDICGNEQPMGGIATMLCGDFRQILPVVRNGTRANIVNACLKKSVLWQEVKVRILRQNMRVQLHGDREAGHFANQLLEIGNGLCPPLSDPDIISVQHFGIVVHTMDHLIRSVFQDFLQNYTSTQWLSERAILAPLNESVIKLNQQMIEMMPGESRIYLSHDSTISEDEATHYPTEFLNSIETSGIPSHRLELKIEMPVMIMRSMNPPKLMNGTRCIVTRLSANAVFVKIANGPYQEEVHVIPRISLQPSDTNLTFTFKRQQFPLQPCFAVSINKSQGQTLSTIGIFLRQPVFSHGMLYVAMSRTGRKDSVYILAPDSKTRNVVYPEVLR